MPASQFPIAFAAAQGAGSPSLKRDRSSSLRNDVRLFCVVFHLHPLCFSALNTSTLGRAAQGPRAARAALFEERHAIVKTRPKATATVARLAALPCHNAEVTSSRSPHRSRFPQARSAFFECLRRYLLGLQNQQRPGHRYLVRARSPLRFRSKLSSAARTPSEKSLMQ